MKLVALTGSIGMGKSETLKMFAKKGVSVFDSDKTVHELYEKGSEGALYIKKHFPKAIKNGKVDRAVLSKIVMQNPLALKQIEDAIHPIVKRKQKDFIESRKNEEILIFDIPLLFESGRADEFDQVIVVSTPEDVQKTRVLKRPGMTEEKFSKIKARQISDAEKRAKADFIIETDKGFSHAEKRVEEILKDLNH